MWRHIGNSVEGSAHATDGVECQDSCVLQVLGDAHAPVLIACIADGAGSSKFGADGSRMAGESIVECVTAYLASRGSIKDVTADDVLRWCESVRQRIQVAARARDTTARDFATTLCAAILSDSRAVFFQVGDGAIIVRRQGVYGVVFWPQSGEYANTTNFLTDEQFEQALEFLALPVQVVDVALLTDGVQRLALTFESQTPHPPFFQPLFEALRSTSDVAGLDKDMRRFLESRSVQDRSDDDKTLVLASWVEGEPA
jgi:hypothetical protein